MEGELIMIIYNFYLFASVAASIPWELLNPVAILYFGPETILPVASFIAGIIGIIMMFGRFILRFIRKSFNRLFGRQKPVVEGDFSIDLNSQNTPTTSTDES